MNIKLAIIAGVIAYPDSGHCVERVFITMFFGLTFWALDIAKGEKL